MLRISVFLLLIVSPAHAAEEKPGFGMVYDTKENSGLQMNCKEASWNEVRCDFKQIAIFKKAKESELQQKIEEARQQFISAPKDQIVPKDCSEFENTLSYLRGGKSNISSDVRSNVQKLTKRERQDLEQNTAMLVAFCKNPTEENAVSMARFALQKDAKTCRIYTSQYSLTFQRITADTWASNQGPDGLCGVVSVSRLERVVTGSSSFWVYTTKRVVNNKRSSSSPEICKSLDESEHFFDWKGGGERFVGCDYVEMNF